MCTWISKAALCALILTVAGCGNRLSTLAESDTRGASVSTKTSSKSVQPSSTQSYYTTALIQGEVTIAGPKGYCVDPTVSVTDSDVPFVLFGNCATISKSASAPQPDLPALLTASVAPKGQSFQIDGAEGDLNTFFNSEQGRKMLSSTSDAATVSVRDGFVRDGVFYLNVIDSGKGPIPGVAPEQWRAYLVVGERMVSASMLSFQAAPLDAEKGLTLIKEFTSKIQSSQQEAPVPPLSIAPQPVVAPKPASKVALKVSNAPAETKFQNVGLLRRLIGQ